MPETLTAQQELEALRTSNAELVKKSRDRKAKVAEHEATITDLEARLTSAETALADATVGAPLRSMAATLSPVPSLWLAEFAKHYKLESVNGKLQVLGMDGKPVMDGDAVVEFSAPAMVKLLIGGQDAELGSFPHIMYGSKATGGGASPSLGSQVQYPEKQKGNQPERPQFGLR